MNDLTHWITDPHSVYSSPNNRLRHAMKPETELMIILIDRHCDQNSNVEPTRISFPYLNSPVTLAPDKFREIVCSLSFACLECEVNFTWLIEIVPSLIVLYEQVSI